MAAAALMTVLVTMAVIIPLTFVGGKLVYEASNSYQTIVSLNLKKQSPRMLQDMVDRLPLPAAARRLLSRYEFDEQMAIEQATAYGNEALILFSRLLTSAAKSAGGFVLSAIAFLFFFFFACKDGETWYRTLLRAIPPSYGIEEISGRMAIGASTLFWGVAGTCVLQGITGGIAFLALGLPSPFLAGSLMALCALLPVVGTALVWLPAALWLALTGAMGKAVILMVVGAGIIGTMDNITRPMFTKLVGAQMPVLTVTIGAIGGIIVYGLTGLIVGPLALELFSWLLEHLGRIQEEKL
jgi:predicted PurR-regulated permease PerM